MTFDGSTLNTSVNGTEILALADTSQIIGVAGSDVNIVLNQTTDNISMYMDAGEGQGYKQVIDIDGDAGNSEINIGLQTEVYLKVGIGSGPNIRMLSGSDTWFYVDPDDQRLGNNAAGGSYINITSGGDIDMYRASTRYFDLNDEIMRLGLSGGIRIDIDYGDDEQIDFYDINGNRQMSLSQSGISLDSGGKVNQFSNNPDPSDDVNSDADNKVFTVEASDKYVQQTMSHNFMEPQTINRRAAESLKYGLGLDYLSYSTFSTSQVTTTESVENVMVALQNGRGMLVFIATYGSIRYRLVNETGTSFVGDEKTAMDVVAVGPYENLSAALLPNGNVVVTALDAEFAPANGTSRHVMIDQDGTLLSSASTIQTVDQYVAPVAVTPGGNWLSVAQQGTGHVSGKMEYVVYDQNNDYAITGNSKEIAVANVGSVTTVGLLDNTFMIFFSDSTGNNYYQIDRFGEILKYQTYLGGTDIASSPKAILMNNGNVFLSYLDAGGDGYFQIVAPSGEIRQSETQISSGAVSNVVAQQFSGGDILVLYESSNQYYYQVRDLDGSVVIAETLQEADDFENAKSMAQFNSGQIVVAYWDGTNRVLEAWAPDSFEIDGELKIDGDLEVTGDLIISGDVKEHHNSLLGLQGGDSTAEEFYHLTQSIHDGLFSASPIIGIGSSTGTNLQVDYGSNLITLDVNSTRYVEVGNVRTIIGDQTGVYLDVDYGDDFDIKAYDNNGAQMFHVTTNVQEIGKIDDTFVKLEQASQITMGVGNVVESTIDGDGLTLKTGSSVNEFSIDGTLAGDSDDAVPTEKATKTYVDTQIQSVISLESINDTEPVINGDSTATIIYDTPQVDSLYSVVGNLVNEVDAQPSIYGHIITEKTLTGFVVLFSGPMDSANYEFDWILSRNKLTSSSSSSSSRSSSSSSASLVGEERITDSGVARFTDNDENRILE